MQNNHQQYVTFAMNQDLYGLAVSQTREILDKITVTKVPRSSAELLGVINLRGQVVPVIDLRLKLKLANTEAQAHNSCLIIAEVDIDSDLHIVGIQVDEVREVLELSADMIEPAPRLGSSINTRFIKGMGKIGEHFLVLLDINHLFGETEITEFQSLDGVCEESTGELLEA